MAKTQNRNYMVILHDYIMYYEHMKIRLNSSNPKADSILVVCSDNTILTMAHKEL